MKRIAVFALVAMLVISPLDFLQVLTGVRTLGTNPWLTPLKFALVGAILGGLSYWLDPKPHPAKTQAVVLYGFSFACAYIMTMVGVPSYLVFVALLINIIAQGIISIFEYNVSLKEVLPFFILLAIAGPLSEYIDVKMGGFTYLSAPGTIPYWLPLLWGCGAFFTRALVGKEAKA